MAWTADRAPTELQSMQTQQDNVVSYLCALPNEYSVCNMAQHMSYTMWYEVWRKKIEIIDIDGILLQSCSAIGVGKMDFTMKYSMKGIFCHGEAWKEDCRLLLQRDAVSPELVWASAWLLNIKESSTVGECERLSNYFLRTSED